MSESYRRGFDCGYNGEKRPSLIEIAGTDFLQGYLAGQNEFWESRFIHF